MLPGPSANKERELIGEWPVTRTATRDSSNRLLVRAPGDQGQETIQI